MNIFANDSSGLSDNVISDGSDLSTTLLLTYRVYCNVIQNDGFYKYQSQLAVILIRIYCAELRRVRHANVSPGFHLHREWIARFT